MNGRGMPVMGMMPIVIPTFSKTWNANIARIPTHRSVPKKSVESRAVRHVRHTSSANSASNIAPPTKPSSSPTTVKMKSVCCAGT